ncbi:glycoside hydrolase superfamily [Geopyxis carbonaria]|nr:glycoside hydrolase superfamily [Geopyxis carbonaria]
MAGGAVWWNTLRIDIVRKREYDRKALGCSGEPDATLNLHLHDLHLQLHVDCLDYLNYLPVHVHHFHAAMDDTMGLPSPLSPDFALHTSRTTNAFTDRHSRTLLLRGLNVSAGSKLPSPCPPPSSPSFYTLPPTYTQHPFPAAASARHWFTQMRSWGVNIVRLVIVWEALEPLELGTYDMEYIEHIRAIVHEAARVGMRVFVDGHQDCWSRFTGGSGAPQWAFDLVGLDATAFPETVSAALELSPSSDDADTPRLDTPSGRLWPTNYTKFGPATLFTLFFAGELYAPSAVYTGPHPAYAGGGHNVGHVLRSAYTRAFATLMAALVPCGNVVGIDPMNEPHPGYIGLRSLRAWNETTELHLGAMPSAVEGMALAGGEAVGVGQWERSWPHPSVRRKTVTMNTGRRRAWREGREDVWKREGVWWRNDDGTLGGRDDYFVTNPQTGEAVDFERDCYVPFLQSFWAAMPKGTWLFVEPIPNLGPPSWPADPASSADAEDRLVYAPHWYDIRTLFEKALNPTVTFDVLRLAAGSRNFLAHTYFGASGLAGNYAANFSRIVADVAVFRGQARGVRVVGEGAGGKVVRPKPTPVLIGETGVPMDLNAQSFYAGDTGTQGVMLNALLSAMERHRLNWTLWTFTLSHATCGDQGALPCDNEPGARHQAGDGWNSEDFSVVYGAAELARRGGAAGKKVVGGDGYGGDWGVLRLPAQFLRPYPTATAGRLVASGFELAERRFEVEYIPCPVTAVKGAEGADLVDEFTRRTTEVYIPNYHYAGRTSIRAVVIDAAGKGWEEEWIVDAEGTQGQGRGEKGEGKAVGGECRYFHWTWKRREQEMRIVHSAEAAGARVVIRAEALETRAGAGGGAGILARLISSVV